MSDGRQEFFQGKGQKWIFPGGGQKHFSNRANSRKILFYQLETKRITFFY